MKLIYISDVRIPTEKAHGYQICKMCEEFSNSGVDVELWIPTRKNYIKEDVFSFYGIKNNFNIKKIESFDFLEYSKFLRKWGFYLQKIFLFTKLFFKKIKKDAIVYTRNPEIGWLFSLRGFKTVYEAHSWPASKQFIYKFLIKRIYKIVVVTQGLKKLYLNCNFAENKILVAPDAVDLEKFNININKEHAREILGLPKDKIILGYTGTLRTMGEEKGILNVFRALKIINSEKMNILFVAVGGGKNDIIFYKEEAQKLGIKEGVMLLERVNLDKLAIYQKAFDILLIPYFSRIYPFSEHIKYYGSALKMFEYMASKRPIIAINLPSVREILSDSLGDIGQGNAVLIEPDSPISLVKGIRRILEDKELAKRISEQAFEDIQQYTWRKRVRRILEFIN